MIEREKKGRQRTGTLAPELKKQRLSEETNAQGGLSIKDKRQKGKVGAHS